MESGLRETIRRIIAWLREGVEPPADGGSFFARGEPPRAGDDAVECPWRYRWEHLPKRTAGFGFSQHDYETARARAEEIARVTLGADLWTRVRRAGYLDLPSGRFPGVTYRLRVGRRIEVRCAPGVEPPWRHPYLCINPTYPLPEAEFFAHLYLYVRDNEDEMIRVAAPQPWDQPLGRTF
jgi:hypothetical protein